ncbi:hypothetical protein J1N35_039778 [Gossypium stocksii]|uniref:DUF4283 domain-containing protein n=1 Tax=Gossypium stocksii TaxID=47602 RepID=A0A9D3ZH40_9ROSI|nr:hypothetical protein J1N35_039778 [Gossypium stocksii]
MPRTTHSLLELMSSYISNNAHTHQAKKLNNKVGLVMDADLTWLSLEDREEEGWDVTGGDSGYEPTSYKLCLMFGTPGSVVISNLSDKRFLFRFSYDVDINRVEHCGLWTFNSHLLVFHKLKEGIDPKSISLLYVDF